MSWNSGAVRSIKVPSIKPVLTLTRISFGAVGSMGEGERS